MEIPEILFVINSKQTKMNTISLKFFNAITVLFILLLLSVFLSLSSCEKEKNHKAENLCPVVAESLVPQLVKDSFIARYPATLVTTWFYKDSSSYCALITISSVEKLAHFEIDGAFINEEIEVQQEGEHNDSTSTGGVKSLIGCACETHKEGD